jgi:hypothetical protein
MVKRRGELKVSGKPAVLRSADEERWCLHSLYPEQVSPAVEGCEHRLQFWGWNESNASLLSEFLAFWEMN